MRDLVERRERAPAQPPAAAIEIMAVAHALPADPDPSLVVVRDPSGPGAAAFRALLHRLVELGDPSVPLVTSARPGDGKSFVGANLALALAELGRFRVLLLEADAHHPSLASRFGVRVADSPCFFTQLDERRERPEAPWRVIELAGPPLHLLPVRPGRRRSPAPIEGALLAAALADLRRAYDYVVVDGPDVLAGGDVNLIEDAADGLLFVAQARRTPGRLLRRALEQVSPARLLGLVLLGT